MIKMKLMCLVVALGYTSLNAEVWSQQKKIDLNFEQMNLVQLFEKIQQQTNLRFVFNLEDIQGYNVNGSANGKTISEILDIAFREKPLKYEILKDHIVISRTAGLLPQAADMVKIKGRVTDSKGNPLPGVTVMLKGTSFGGATDMDGKYEVSVKNEPTTILVFSFVGMKTKEIHTNGKTEINVELEDNNTQLEDVVVTGIFQKARESYTGAVSSVTKEKLQMYKGQNLLQTLKNIDASLNIPMSNLSGSNPNSLPQMSIRGSSSLPMSVKEFNEQTKQSVNTPLIILDGFEISLTKLMDYNDEEIESINILKDAAATAIYGSRGANGVIVVQTKKPTPGKLRVSAQVGLNLEIPDLSSYDVLNAADKLELERSIGLYEDAGAPGSTVKYQQRYYERLKDVLSGVNTDWLSQPLRNGVGQRYNLRLEGGSDEFRWGTSISYNDIQGAMKGSSRKTFNGDITLMYTINKLIFRNYTSIGNTNGVESKYGSFNTYVDQQPYNKPWNEAGGLNRYFNGFGPSSSSVQNPLYNATLNSFDKNNNLDIINNFSIEWKVLPELTLRGQFGLSAGRSSSDYFLPGEHSTFNTNEYADAAGSLRKGKYTYGTGNDLTFDGRLTISYSKLFAEKHQVYVGMDYSVAESKNKNYQFIAEGFGNDDLSFLGNALQYEKNGAPSGSNITTRRIGFTGNVNYMFDNRYYVDGSFRIDGSSQFGSNKRFAPFWSVGLGWNLHNEKFMEDQAIINRLRLRGSIGETGTVDFSQAQTETMYKYTPGDRYLSWNAAHLQGLGNPDLTWQKTNELNLGIEFGVLEDRITGTFDVYSKKTSNLLSSRDMPLSMGFNAYSDNVGEVKNTGFEAAVSIYVIRDRERDFSWMVSGQLIYNKNEITKLSDAIMAQNEEYLKKDDVDVANLFYVGRPQHSVYAVRSLGIDPSTGNEVFLDRNGNATYTWSASDKVYLGPDAIYSSPYRGNASTMLKWKDLTFNVSFGYQWGGKTYNQTLVDRVELTDVDITLKNVDKRVFTDRWQKPGDITFFKKHSNESTKASSRFVMDNKWFEIQSISLQYRWASETLKKATRLQSVIFGVNMSDIWHFSSIKYERGVEYPFARNVKGTITLSF